VPRSPRGTLIVRNGPPTRGSVPSFGAAASAASAPAAAAAGGAEPADVADAATGAAWGAAAGGATGGVPAAAGCPTPPTWPGVPGDLLARARALADAPPPSGAGRRILGLAGAPGAGKSTLAAALAAALGPVAAVVPMDGFHLAGSVLRRLGREGRKGAPDTFDPDGYAALLRRLRAAPPALVYAPEFRRDIEEPVAGAVEVHPRVRLVVTEGNYLLVPTGGWAPVRALLDEAWYVEVDERLRMERLIARHRAHGRTAAAAAAWARGSDQRNAELIAGTRARADLTVRLDRAPSAGSVPRGSPAAGPPGTERP